MSEKSDGRSINKDGKRSRQDTNMNPIYLDMVKTQF
jgi:hypothetical protein